ncbi:Fe-S cluster assembly protein SufD [Ferrovibrio sp.]|uniref:Fe-S cluster assembly protein SufD n=1 Tax=Ferrovibrio sp. TaxID=1917215 RepID=UPI0035B4733D
MSGFAEKLGALAGGLPQDAATPLRQAGLAAFRRHGLPHKRLEDWKFTGLGDLDRNDWLLAANDATPFGTLPQDASLKPLAEAVAGEPGLLDLLMPETTASAAMAALNAGLLRNAWLLDIAPGAQLSQPITLAHRGVAGQLENITLFMRLGQGAQASLLESHQGAGWYNGVLRLRLAQNAVLEHARLQTGGKDAYHTALLDVHLAQGARYRHVSLLAGAGLARHEMQVCLAGEAAEADISGLALPRGDGHLDHSLRLEHAAAHCRSAQLFKNAVDEAGHAVFQGRIRVAPGAQRTDAQQLCRTLLLSDEAQVDTKPELEILADDVSCSHGATVGDLDAGMLFYMQARGIPAETARRLLLQGFAEEITQALEDDALRAPFADAVAHGLGSAA